MDSMVAWCSSSKIDLRSALDLSSRAVHSKGDGVVGVIYDLYYSARVTPGTPDLCNT